MKQFDGDGEAHATQAMGEDPSLVLKLDFRNSGTRWYADRDIGAWEGRLLNVAPITAQKKQDSVGMVGAFDVDLDDSDGALKSIMDADDFERTPASLYQFFEGGTGLTLLFKGEVVGPIEWSEGQRTFKFDIETKVIDLPVGFSVDKDLFDANRSAYPLLNPDVIGKAWPLCYGSAVHVPALKVLTPPRTVLNQRYRSGTSPEQTSFLVDDSTYFPQGEVDVIIDGMVFRGTFNGNTFTVFDPNVPKYEGLAFDQRDASDPDKDNPFVAWLSQPTSIANNFIYINDEFKTQVYYRVVKQEGKKIWLDKKYGHYLAASLTPALLQAPTTIQQVAKKGRKGWGIRMDYVGGLLFGYHVESDSAIIQTISDVDWDFDAGTEVQLWKPDHSSKYVANLLPSNLVKATYAFRTNPKNGVRQLWAVPSQYYAVETNATLLGQTCTVVTLPTPLNELVGQGFEDQIYVSLKSSVGPNVSDVVKHLFQTWSSLAPDATTFAAVKALVTNYPVGFAIFDQPNVMKACEDIAWQARCGLIYEGGTVLLKYLSKEPSVDYTIGDSKVEHRTILLGFTSTEDIVTRLTARWKRDYSGIKYRDKIFLYSENQSKYGLRKREQDFDIYNVDSLAIKSAKFWGHRLANSWRFLRCNILERKAMALDLFDCVQAGFVDASLIGATFKTVVEAHSYNTNDDDSSFSVSLWLPSIAGTTVQDPNAWMSDVGDVLPADPVDNLQETPIVVEYPDDLSRHVMFRPPQTHAAIIVRKDTDKVAPGAYVVYIYDNGYPEHWPPTAVDTPSTVLKANGTPLEFRAYPVEKDILHVKKPNGNDVELTIPNGTKVGIFTVTGDEWMFHVPADKASFTAVVTSNIQVDGTQTVDIYPDGPVAPDGTPQTPTDTNVPTRPADPTNPPASGEQVTGIWKGGTVFTQPVGGDMFWARIKSGGSGADYNFEEWDPVTDAVKVGGRTGSAREINGTIVVPRDNTAFVFIKTFVNGTPPTTRYRFFYPLETC